MTLPAGLFVDSPETQDVTLHPLSEDVEIWPEEIVQKFKERIADSEGLNMVVKFMKKDEENGTATGSIAVSNEKKQATIPLIVKDFSLFPLDIFIAGNRLLPLNSDYFRTFFQDNETFQKLEEYPVYGGLGRFDDSNMLNAIYPPNSGRYSYASAGYDILDQISDTIDGTEFKKYLENHPGVAINFKKQGHAEIIKKVANLQAVNMNEFRQGVDNLIQRPISVLKREGPNKYTILSNSDQVFSPAITTVDREEAHKFVSKICDKPQDEINDVDQNGEKLLTVPERPSKDSDRVFVEGPAPERIELAEEFDHYKVKSKRGVMHEGVVIPKVIDFNMKILPLKIFIGKTMATVQPEIAGMRVENSTFNLEKRDLAVGQSGTFVYQPSDKKALATMPVTIESIVEDCGSKKITVMDLVGNPYKLKFSPDMGHLERIAALPDGSYTMPKEFKWIPMEGFEEISNSAPDYFAKSAGSQNAYPVKVIPTGYDQYSIKGVNKYADALGWDSTNLNRAQTTFLLASLGSSGQEIDEIYKVAQRTGLGVANSLKFTPLRAEKIAKAVPLAKRMKKVADGLKRNLTKEASYVGNSQTVDTLLSLNFVSPENVSKFVSKVPQFKSSISNLASCLIASRLGLEEIPEQAASSAMNKLVEVVDGLESLRASQEMEAQ